MNKEQKPSKRKKGASVGIAICFVAAIAIVGTYTLRDYQETKRKELAIVEDMDSTEDMVSAGEEEQPAEEANTDNLTVDTEEETGENDAAAGDSTDTGENQAAAGSQTAGTSTSVNFTEDSQLLWPVDGNILMSYSMDKTVYFSTLDQYKYNPAMIISGAEGDQVICGAPGIIKSIDVTAQTGTTVTVDLGNGYELLYGQLKEVPVNVGDYVEAKTVLGYVSEPTKYYSVEGSNVYFEMRKDGQPVNPMDYMAEE